MEEVTFLLRNPDELENLGFQRCGCLVNDDESHTIVLRWCFLSVVVGSWRRGFFGPCRSIQLYYTRVCIFGRSRFTLDDTEFCMWVCVLTDILADGNCLYFAVLDGC